MILGVQDRIRGCITGSGSYTQMATNITAVNGKYGGVNIVQPTDVNVFDFENGTINFDSTNAAVLIQPQSTEYGTGYASDGIVSVTHTILVYFIMRDYEPDSLNQAKLMMAEAAAPALTKEIRDGANIYQSYIQRTDFFPQYAEGQFRVTDVMLTLIVKEYINQESVTV